MDVHPGLTPRRGGFRTWVNAQLPGGRDRPPTRPRSLGFHCDRFPGPRALPAGHPAAHPTAVTPRLRCS